MIADAMLGTLECARRLGVGCLLFMASTLVGSIASADAAREVDLGDERVRVAASERYRAGRVHRFALGDGYRDLWQTGIELPLLDLGRIGGGLTPTRRFGGLQTAVLGFKGADGRSYTFRGTDKDPSAVLDPMLWDTIVQVIVQDQMAAQHPGGPSVAGILTDAAGIVTVHERMVVMPDDPTLGEFREEFAGMVGTFFEYPQAAKGDRAGFAGALELIDHEELYERLATGDGTRVDVEAFLRARLVDLLLGDFDRHRKQWRWMRLPGVDLWQPLPEDRDQAFVRYDGVAQRIMKVYLPILQNYGPEYPFVKGLTLHGWEQDRWLLPALSWSDWEVAVAAIQAALTDDVIDSAIATLPPEYAALDAERLRRDVRGRRDHLPEVARRFYEHLAREVDVQTSDRAEIVDVLHGEDGSMTVTIRGTAERAGEALLFDRRFEACETREVRIYLRDGADRVSVTGGDGEILLRLISPGGEKRIDDSFGGRTRVYDESESVALTEGANTERITRAYVPPPPESGFVDVEDVPPRDWGSDTVPYPDFGYQPDVGVLFGGSISHTRYGFRKHPWSSKHSIGFGWSFGANAPRVRYRAQFRPENSESTVRVDLRYSGIEVLRFYGFGNESRDDGSDKNFRVRNEQYYAGVGWVTPLPDDRFRVAVGPYVEVSQTFRGVRLFDQIDPYGNHDFAVAGLSTNFRFDTRTSLDSTAENLELPFHENPAAGYPTRGVLFDVTGRFSQPIDDLRDPYGTLRGSVSGYVSFGENARATLALRVGGEHTFGRTPYFDQATIGGGRFFSGDVSNRGFRPRRFLGDSSVYANLDLRIVLARVKIVVPGDLGVQGFFDVGRVFLDEQSSAKWHPSGGGGLWFSPLTRTNTLSLSVAGSDEDTLVYFRLGFPY